jgi:hypothetical protein
MKPCSKNFKLIAWLALNALEAKTASALREHLALCEGCRCYWKEISNVTEGLAAAGPDTNLEASESFHREVAERLQAAEAGSVLPNLAGWLCGSVPRWRVALPTAVALALALFAMVAPQHPPLVSSSAPSWAPVAEEAALGGDPAPTIANYQMVARQSLEKLDQLLLRQGNRRLPPAPVFTASGLQLAQGAF